MGRTLLSVVLFCVNLLVYGQFITPGTGVNWTFDDLVLNSGGVVTVDNSIYTVHGDLTISASDTLKIISNDHITFDPNVLITVYGAFIANPPAQAILTASNPEQFFKGFRFENSPASVLYNCLIEYGGGIQIIGSNMTIEDCMIRHFNKSNTTGTLQVSQGRVNIIDNEIYQNQGPAIASAANAQAAPQIIGNHIWSNNTANTNMPQINLGNSGNDTIRIIGNTITGQFDQAGGIAVSTLYGGNCYSIIDDNIITNNRYGIAAIGSNIHSEIHNNVLADNNIQGIPNLGGSGINFNGSATNTAMVSGNTISGNLWGITVQNSALPNLGERDFIVINPGENYIYGNGNEGVTYALYNNTPQDLKAQYNYWGTTNPDSVEMVIVHQPDDPSLGFVDYIPFLIPLGTEELPQQTNAQKVIQNIFPNPMNMEGYIQLNKDLMVRKNIRYEILNLRGNAIRKGNVIAENALVRIDVSDIEAGVYFLKVKSGARMEIRTFVVSR
jgi:parallel beta-helix repeat protein